MTAVQAFIVANMLMVAFNLIGMTSGAKPPSNLGFAAIWIGLIVVVEALAYAVG